MQMQAAQAITRRQPQARRRFNVRRLVPLWLLLPSLIVLAVLQFYPTIFSVYISLHRLRARQFIPVEFGNYQRLLNDTNFWDSLQKSLVYVSFTVVLTLFLGMVIAILLNYRSRWNGLYMVMMFIPWVISDVVAGTIWRWMFQNEYGLIQTVIAPLTGTTSLYARPDGALAIVILATIWRSLPFTSLLFLGALQTVPTEVVESAALDGAGRATAFFRVVFPIIRPTFMVALILATIGGLNSVGLILVLTGNIPATKTASVYLYQQGWQFGDFGLGAAISVVMFLINLALTLVYLQFQRQE
jgi:ABC-type sugar transport system permease subunit